MELQQIIEALSIDGEKVKFPREAILAAQKKQDEVTKYLLQYFNQIIHPEIEASIAKDDSLKIFGLYLLAQFQEKKAFPLLIEYCKRSDLDYEIGDVITEALDKILYSTYDGNDFLIKSLIECEEADTFARIAALKVYATVKIVNKEGREELIKYVSDVMDEEQKKMEQDEDYDIDFSTFILSIIQDVKLREVLPKAEAFYEMDMVDISVYGYYDEFVNFFYTQGTKMVENVKTVAEEISNWAWFEQEKPEKRYSEKELQRMLSKEMEPEKQKKIGRNDSCPCGSGKKYKHCCLVTEGENKNNPMYADREKWLKDYPRKPKTGEPEAEGRIYLEDFYDEEYIEIDKLVYLALTHRATPMWEQRETEEQMIHRKLYYLKQAYELFQKKVEKEQIADFKTYDTYGKIHYGCKNWMDVYLAIMEKKHIPFKEEKVFYEKLN